MVHGLSPPGRDRVRGRDDLAVEGRPAAVRVGALGASKGASHSAFKRRPPVRRPPVLFRKMVVRDGEFYASALRSFTNCEQHSSLFLVEVVEFFIY